MPRHRDPDADRRIIDAALVLLARDGYAALNLTTVAEAAGVGKPTLYRRYASKAELVLAATIELSLKPDVPNTGGFADDIRIAVMDLIRALKIAPREVLGDQIGRAMADADFRMKLREAHIDPSLVRMVEVWKRGVARGEVDPTLDGARALRDLSSAVLMQVMLYDDQDEERFVSELVSRFLRSVRP